MSRRRKTPDELWEEFLRRGERPLQVVRALFRRLPSSPRCKLCNAPFAGPGRFVSVLLGKRPWKRNPNVCGFCVRWAQAKGPGGAEVDASLVFADVRGSTELAERLPPTEYRQLINRFFAAASDAIVEHDGIIDQLVGDEAIGLFVRGPAGDDFTKKAVACARAILDKTGHRSGEGPWVPVGIGVHRGRTFVGMVGEGDRFTDFTSIGDAVNTTARLAAAAGAGEILVSVTAADDSSVDLDACEQRLLELKGKTGSTRVRVLC